MHEATTVKRCQDAMRLAIEDHFRLKAGNSHVAANLALSEAALYATVLQQLRRPE